MGGILPFGAIFIELFFIMTSVWLQARDGVGWDGCSRAAKSIVRP